MDRFAELAMTGKKRMTEKINKLLIFEEYRIKKERSKLRMKDRLQGRIYS